MTKQLENDADIVSFGCYREYKSKTVVQLPPLYSSPKDMCLSLVAKQRNGKIVNVGIWGRLIRRSLYAENHIKALPGANMAEDLVTRLAYFAKRIGVLNEPLAHYNLQNTGSYVNNVTMQTMLQTDRNFKAVFDFFVDKGDDYVEAVYRAQSGLLYRNAVSGSGTRHSFFAQEEEF